MCSFPLGLTGSKMFDFMSKVLSGISWPACPMELLLWGWRISGKGTSGEGVECIWQITKFGGAQRFWLLSNKSPRVEEVFRVRAWRSLAVVVAGFVCGAVSVVFLPALVMVSASDTSLMSQVCPYMPLKDSGLKYHWGPIWEGNWSCLRANTCVSFLFQAPNWKGHAIGNMPTPHTCMSM